MDESNLDTLIDTLLGSREASARAKAAKALGDAADNMSEAQSMKARDALNEALSDPDGMVIAAVMDALAAFSRAQEGSGGFEVHGDAMEDMLEPEAAVCSVCGKPEMLISKGGCGREDCPYA